MEIDLLNFFTPLSSAVLYAIAAFVDVDSNNRRASEKYNFLFALHFFEQSPNNSTFPHKMHSFCLSVNIGGSHLKLNAYPP